MAQNILIVEDEGLIAADIASSVARIGHAVTAIASSGEEAMALLKTSTPDLILMDIRLKGELDGIEAALKVRLEYDIPVVFLTSHADSDTLARAKDATPYGYLTKPFRHPVLASTIEMALARHQSDQALVQREAWLASVLYATPNPTIVTDVAGRIEMCSASAERLLGCALADVKGVTWTVAAPLFDEDSGAEFDDVAANAMEQRRTFKLPSGTLLKKADGVHLHVEGQFAPRLVQGKIAGAIITLHDITERIQEERFRREDQKKFALAQLASGAAGEFANHLAAIRKHGEALAATVSAAADSARVRALLSSADRAAAVTDRLLTLSDGLVQMAGTVDVNQAILRVVDVMTPGVESAILIDTALDPKAGAVRMECKDFEQVLIQLLVNAFQAMPDGGGVMVSTAVEQRNPHQAVADDARPDTRNFVKVTVRDSGSGLSREAQDHLFEPYFTTKSPGEGEGLGLSVVHALVTIAGGSIVATSTPGMGACFDLYLPVLEHLPSLGRSVHPALSETEVLPSQATRSWTKANDLRPGQPSQATRGLGQGSTGL